MNSCIKCSGNKVKVYTEWWGTQSLTVVKGGPAILDSEEFEGAQWHPHSLVTCLKCGHTAELQEWNKDDKDTFGQTLNTGNLNHLQGQTTLS